MPGGATGGVIGGGPAGAFFAIQVLRKAKELDRNPKVIVFEREQSPGPRSAPCLTASRSACNYCAGGLSPKIWPCLQPG
jgi:flavin-dependent dehydrogenase